MAPALAEPVKGVVDHPAPPKTSEHTASPQVFSETDKKPGARRIAKDFTELIGNTPLVYLNQIADGVGARIAVKLECFNPGGSVKDRMAISMFNKAEEQGLITPGKTVLVEVTSGNTGIGLAILAAQKGYSIVFIIPANYSLEKRTLLLQLGAKLVLTDPQKGVQGVFSKLEEVMKAVPNSYCLNQFENAANPDIHFATTGPEIWNDTAGQVDIFVAASGTGGTITGVSRYLKSKNPKIHTVVIEPAESAVLSGGEHHPHKIQGTGPGFIPPILDRSVIDEVFQVKSDDALQLARDVALSDGLLVGISSGAALKAALEVGKREENKGKLIVVVFASGAERYLSTELFQESWKTAESLTIDEVFDLDKLSLALQPCHRNRSFPRL